MNLIENCTTSTNVCTCYYWIFGVWITVLFPTWSSDNWLSAVFQNDWSLFAIGSIFMCVWTCSGYTSDLLSFQPAMFEFC